MANKKMMAVAKEAVGKVRTYWKTPPLGNYMNYKEIVSLAGGGIGIKFIITFVQATIISANNVFVGNTIGIAPEDMTLIYVLSVLAGFPLTMLRAKIIDGSRSRYGKYRPYIISMGLPTVLLSIGYVWAPYEIMPSIFKIITVVIFNIGFQFCYNFLYDAYDNYISVLSSNTQERANVSSIRAVTDSLAPTITNAIIPILGGLVTGTDNLYDMRIYRIIWPPILIIGFLLSLIVFKNTREKIIQARTHIVQIRFIDAFRVVMKNKYFWIISLAGWVGFLENMTVNILGWLYTYQHACTPAEYSLITTIYGNASLWGMMMAPFSIRKFGKRNTLIFTNALNIVFLASLYPVIRYANPAIMIWLVMCCLWMNALVGSFAHILTPSVNADIRDYQQYITGERIDGMFAAVGLVGSVVTMLTTGIQNIINKYVGFNETKLAEVLPKIIASGQKIDDPTNVYNVLYDNDTFISVMAILIMTTVLGAAMNVIPYFFYDLSELKQKSIVRVLKIRSMFEDFGNNVLDDGKLVEAVDIIRTSRELSGATPREVDKNSYKSIKDKAERKAAKKAYNDDLKYNEEIKIADFVCEELDKFSSEEFIFRVSKSREIYDAGLEGIRHADLVEVKDMLQAARALPRGTEQEKAIRKASVEIYTNLFSAVRSAYKYYPEGTPFEQPSFTMLEEMYAEQEAFEKNLKELNDSLKGIKAEGDKQKLARTKSDIKELSAKIKDISAAAKKLTDEIAKFNRAAKPYLDAKRIITQAENYTHFDEISETYDAAKARYEAALAAEKEEEARKEAAEKEHAAMLREQRKARKNKKK